MSSVVIAFLINAIKEFAFETDKPEKKVSFCPISKVEDKVRYNNLFFYISTILMYFLPPSPPNGDGGGLLMSLSLQIS